MATGNFLTCLKLLGNGGERLQWVEGQCYDHSIQENHRLTQVPSNFLTYPHAGCNDEDDDDYDDDDDKQQNEDINWNC